MTKAEGIALIMSALFLWAIYELYRAYLATLASQPIIATSGETEGETKK